MSVTLRDEESLHVLPLSAAELDWAKKLDALMGKMPKRLKLIEIDDNLMVVDAEAASKADGGFGSLEDGSMVLADIGNAAMKISGMTF